MVRNITQDIYYVGVNDRQKHAFENYLPLPYGVAYNSYLIVDEKVVLVDTVDLHFVDIFLSKIDEVLHGRSIDYLIVNHVEPDHSGSIRLLKNKYPDIKIVGNVKTIDMLKGFYGISDNYVEVKEAETLNIGKRTLSFYLAPMVHWPEVMVTYEPEQKILFSADAFGCFGTLDGGIFDDELNLDHIWDEMRRYYACIVGKYGVPTQAALKKLGGLPINIICATHGPIWRTLIPKVVNLYDQWSKYQTEKGVVIAYGSMYGNTEQMAEAVAHGVASTGIKDIVLYNVSKTDSSFILSDVFKYKGFIVGSPTYMAELYPLVDTLLSKINHRGVKNHYFGCFGSYSWASQIYQRMTDFQSCLNWEMVAEPVKNKFGFDQEDYSNCFKLGVAMGERLLKG